MKPPSQILSSRTGLVLVLSLLVACGNGEIDNAAPVSGQGGIAATAAAEGAGDRAPGTAPQVAEGSEESRAHAPSPPTAEAVEQEAVEPEAAPLPGDVAQEPAVESASGNSEPFAAPLPTAVEPPPAVEEVYSGRTRRFQHPRGWYSFDMPRAWSAEMASEEVVVVQPGLRPGDRIDAILLVTHGELEDQERSQTIEQLFASNQAEIRELMAELELKVEGADGPPERVLVGELPGAVQTWSGRTADGQPVTVWIGAVARREYFLAVVGVLVREQSGQYLPGLKRILTSLQLTPPERNTSLEGLLAGRRIGSSSVHSGGSTTWLYDFFADGSFRRETIMSFSGLGVSGGSSEERGRWEVIGDELFLYSSSGQEVARPVVEGGRLVGVRFGERLYGLR